MAKRRTREQIEADKIIKARLNEMGEDIYQNTRDTSRVKTGQLFNSINYMVKPDTTLTMSQVYYGKFNRPKGQNDGPKNALLIAIEKRIDNITEIIVKDITDQILKDF